MVRLSRLKNSITSDVNKLEEVISQDRTLYKKSVTELNEILSQYQRGIQLILSTGHFQSTDTQDMSNIHGTLESKDTPCKENHDIVIEYSKTLQNIATNVDSTTTFGKMIYILNRWYQRRFIDKTDTPQEWKRFVYNTKYIKEWICAIIIYFAYCHEQHSEDAFISDFNSWINMIGHDKITTERYALYTPIHNCNKYMSYKYCTVSALILWDMFLDAGYMNLCRKYNIYTNAPYHDELPDIIGKYAADKIDEYDRYDNIKIISELYDISF